MTQLHFEFGPGEGHRLLAMGLPDHIFASGESIVWLSEDGVFHWAGDRIEYRSIPPVTGISGHNGRWAFCVDSEQGTTILQLEPDGTGREVCLPVRSIEVGTRLVVLDHGQERTAYDLGQDCPWPLPVGARDGRPKPFTDGLGAVWLDGTQVLRLRDNKRPQIAGRLPSRPEAWTTGPDGSAVFSLAEGLWGMGASGGPKHLGALDFASCRFAPCGKEMMTIDPDGWARVDLMEGRVVERRRGSLIPVGYAPTPIILDEDAGLLKTSQGLLRATGLTPCASANFGGVLYGPGGTAWSTHTGEPLWDKSPLCGEHLAATDGGVIQVGRRIEAFDLEGNKVVDLPLPIDPELDGEIFDLHWVDGMMFFEVEDGWVQVDFEGRRVGLSEPRTHAREDPSDSSPWSIDPENGWPSNGGHTVPLAFDGVLSLDDGRGLAWSEDGMLAVLDPDRL